jgi:hypothetical protein
MATESPTSQKVAVDRLGKEGCYVSWIGQAVRQQMQLRVFTCCAPASQLLLVQPGSACMQLLVQAGAKYSAMQHGCPLVGWQALNPALIGVGCTSSILKFLHCCQLRTVRLCSPGLAEYARLLMADVHMYDCQ